MKRYRLQTPTGVPIIGILETLEARADAMIYDENGEPEYEGGSQVFWDSQRPKLDGDEDNGGMQYLDEDGDIWLIEQLTKIEVADDE